MPTFLWLHDPPHHFGDNLFPTLLRLFPLHFSVISGPLPIFVITCPPLLWLHAPTLIFVNTCFLLFIISSPMNFVSTGSLYFLCLHIFFGGGGTICPPFFGTRSPPANFVIICFPFPWLMFLSFLWLCSPYFCNCSPHFFYHYIDSHQFLWLQVTPLHFWWLHSVPPPFLIILIFFNFFFFYF